MTTFVPRRLLQLIAFPQNSILRRSLLLLAFTVPAAALNLGLIYAANLLLDHVAFGIFYLAVTIVNVLFAPSQVLSFFYSRALVQINAQHGESVARAAILELAWRLSIAGLVLSAIAAAGLWALGELLSVQSFKLILLIVGIT